MQPRITLVHDTIDTLKASPLWAEIMRLFCPEDESEPVQVIEIRALDKTDHVKTE